MLDKAKEIIKQFEGCKLTAYRCPAGVWTCGWGSTQGVGPETVWTQEQADHELERVGNGIETAINQVVKVQLNDNQMAALVSFTYNVGFGAFSKSTLLRKINSQAPAEEIQTEFLRWNKGGGKVLPGLTRRREAEAKLYVE